MGFFINSTKMKNIIFLQQDVEKIKEKIEAAPDKWYEIGVAIGSFLPFIILVALAYFIYKKTKNRSDL